MTSPITPRLEKQGADMASRDLSPSGGVKLDTSGEFHVMPGHPLHRFMAANVLRWSDLDAFTQGYIEALPWESLLAVAVQRGGWAWLNEKNRETDSADVRYFEASWRHLPGLGSYVKVPAFSDLAPETLARIIADCAAFLAAYPPDEDYAADAANDGRYFWRDRNQGLYAPNFPPLTPYLGDDGCVYLREAA